jgi:3-phosphoinositide dependent protein kinase-1
MGHDKLVDFWTFGCLIYEMLVGRPPFRHNNQSILFSRIKMATYHLPEDMDEDAANLISSLLIPDVSL